MARLLAALDGAAGLTIDVSGLVGADMSVLQVLVAARKSALARGVPIGLAGAAGPLRAVLVRAGFLSPAGLPLTQEGDFWTGSITR